MEHPYLMKYLEAPLQLHKLKLECLQKRMALMPLGITDYEKNEVMLEKIKTSGEIKAQLVHVGKREAHLVEYFTKEIIPGMEDMDNNSQSVIEQARKRSEPEIAEALSKLIFIPIGKMNMELKLHEYKILKNLLK